MKPSPLIEIEVLSPLNYVHMSDAEIKIACENSPMPLVTKLILGTNVGRWFRKVVECKRIHKTSYGLFGRQCYHWRVR